MSRGPLGNLSPLRTIWLKEYAKVCEELIEQLSVKIVLDIACGTGSTSIPYSVLGVRSVLLDISRVAVKEAMYIYKNQGLQAEFIVADAFHLPFHDQVFDMIITGGLFEHFNHDSLASLLREIRSYAKNLMIMIPLWRNIGYRLAKALSTLLRRWPFGQQLERDVKENELTEAILKAGLKPSTIRIVGHTGHIGTLAIILLPSVILGKVMSVTIRSSNRLSTRLLHQAFALSAKLASGAAGCGDELLVVAVNEP